MPGIIGGMRDRLTPKQEKFVNALVSGMSQREAYMSAYVCSRWKPETVDSQASRTMANPKIRARYDELVAEAAKKAVFDRRRAIEALTVIVDIGIAHIKQTQDHRVNFTEKGSREVADLPRGAATVISAIDKLDRLLQLSESGDGSGGVTIVDNIPRPSDG